MRALLLVGLLAAGCTRHNAAVKEISVAATAEHVKNGTATPCDANDDEYRQAVGHLPRAVLLSAYRTYDLKELPADKTRPLIFYCTSKT